MILDYLGRLNVITRVKLEMEERGRRISSRAMQPEKN